MAPLFTGLRLGFGRVTAADASGAAPAGITATGGDTTSTPGDGYKYHYFTSTGNSSFVITSGNDSIQYLVVGGGVTWPSSTNCGNQGLLDEGPAGR